MTDTATYILHISDLHFVKNADSYNTETILRREAKEKVGALPLGRKLLIVTGDFHNFWDRDYDRAERFLRGLAEDMGLELSRDVFVVPGNHDVGNDTALEPFLKEKDPDWKLNNTAYLQMLKLGKKEFLEKRLRVFRPYCAFVRRLGLYDAAGEEDAPAQTHLRCWRDRLRLLHLNTALIADGTEKVNQLCDADAAAEPGRWEAADGAGLPVLALGHNSFYDLKQEQRLNLAAVFALHNVRAYLCGDRHLLERDPEQQMIRLESGYRQGEAIPNLVAAKSIADSGDDYSDVGFCWQRWEEATGRVTVEFRRWTRETLGRTVPDGEPGEYTMRPAAPAAPAPKDPESPAAPDPEAALRRYLAEVLEQKRDSHPSFRLLKADEIDSRLYPRVAQAQGGAYREIPARGRITADPGEAGAERDQETERRTDSFPVWELLRQSWARGERRSLVLVGEGGIGKTVALFSLTRSGALPERVPALYVPMYELVDRAGQPLELSEYYKGKYKQYGAAIEALATGSWTERPRLLVLLDGFNEVSRSLRRELLHRINSWHESHPGAQLIAVSRPMDGMNLSRELAGDPISVTLARLEKPVVKAYLREAERELPPAASPLWEELRYPLFLNLYIKTGRLRGVPAAGWPLRVREANSGGALIWNYLQRELLRHNNDEPETARRWVLRCAAVNEYILPWLAHRMVAAQRMDLSYEEAEAWTEEAARTLFPASGRQPRLPRHLKTLWTCWRREYGDWPREADFPLRLWRETVLHDSGVLVPTARAHGEERPQPEDDSFIFMHQNFRDCLAGLQLVNQAETAEAGELPALWTQRQSHLALDYAAALIEPAGPEEPNMADRLWEANRLARQADRPGGRADPIVTCNLLELYRRNRRLEKELNCSGMELRGLSLTNYLGKNGPALPLFRNPAHSRGTRLDRATFESEGHSGPVEVLAVFPDGRVLSGSDDKTLRIWDPATGQCLQSLEGHSGWVNCAAVLPDGRILSGSNDHTLRVWDPATGRCLQRLEGHSGPVSCAAVLPEGRVLSGSRDNTLRVWDPATGQCLQRLAGHSGSVNCAAALPDGRVLSGSGDGTLRVWDPATGQCLQRLEGHSAWASCAAVLPDGRVLSGSGDRTLRVWDPATGQCLQSLEGHSGPVSCAAALPDGRVLSGSWDRTLRVWDSATGQCLQRLEGHSGSVSCAAVLPDGRVLSGSGDKTLRVWDPATGQCLQRLAGHSASVLCAAALPDGRVLSGSDDNTLRVWDPATGQCLQSLEGHSDWVNCAAALPDGRFLSSSDDNTLRVWDPATGQCLQSLEGHSGPVNCAAVLPDGRVLSGSWDGTLRVWDPATGQCLQSLEGHSGSVNCAAVLPDGRVLSGSRDDTLRVWDPATGQCLQTLKGHSGPVLCAAALPDGRVLSGSWDHTLRIWDPATGQCLQTLKGHSNWVSCAAVLPDGRVLSGSDDGTLRLWDPATGQCLQRLEGHRGPVNCATVLPDGRVLSGSKDGTLRVWDPDTGACLDVLEGTEVDVSRMDLSRAELTPELAKLLRQNGARVPPPAERLRRGRGGTT